MKRCVLEYTTAFYQELSSQMRASVIDFLSERYEDGDGGTRAAAGEAHTPVTQVNIDIVPVKKHK